MGVPVDKMTHMVGSYAPKLEAHSYQTPLEDAPSGMLKRGTYTVSSLFTDDDKHEHLKWEWAIDIKKDWKDEWKSDDTGNNVKEWCQIVTLHITTPKYFKLSVIDS